MIFSSFFGTTAKTIRYRRSLNHKRCRPGIGRRYMDDSLSTLREIISLWVLGGVWSFVAIDSIYFLVGNNPQYYTSHIVEDMATSSNCGNILF